MRSRQATAVAPTAAPRRSAVRRFPHRAGFGSKARDKLSGGSRSRRKREILICPPDQGKQFKAPASPGAFCYQVVSKLPRGASNSASGPSAVPVSGQTSDRMEAGGRPDDVSFWPEAAPAERGPRVRFKGRTDSCRPSFVRPPVTLSRPQLLIISGTSPRVPFANDAARSSACAQRGGAD